MEEYSWEFVRGICNACIGVKFPFMQYGESRFCSNPGNPGLITENIIAWNATSAMSMCLYLETFRTIQPGLALITCDFLQMPACSNIFYIPKVWMKYMFHQQVRICAEAAWW